MSCSRGKAAPNDHTRLRLFAESGGFCQNPLCLRALFIDVGAQNLHIAEMAHIFAAIDGGPRTKLTLPPIERGAYENLILLCPSCHTIVDKAEDKYPDQVIQGWKIQHKAKIDAAFGAVLYPNRRSVRVVIEPLLAENKSVFDIYGPNQHYRFDPESEIAIVWKRKVLSKILPNNRRLLAILDENRHHFVGEERIVVERFRQHVDDLEQRHIGDEIASVGTRFPDGMDLLFGDI